MPGVIRRETRIDDPHPLLGFGGRSMVESAVLVASSITQGGVNEAQAITVTGTPTGGFFKLTYEGATTADIAHNASAAVVQAALELLPNIGSGNVLGSGGALPGTPVTITFQNALGKRNVSQMTASHTFTGGTTPAIAVTTAIAGNSTDSGLFIAHRGLIVKKATVAPGSNNKVTPWAGTGTIFGVMARTVSAFDQSDVNDADVPVWLGPGCVFNSEVLKLYAASGYVGNEAAFATWANANGNRVGTQALV
jgi:hypothetical protein